ncbi:hypothetical protein PQX77_020267 [Marasmius sp. AFHP31]|nr:hypothetical protein PQX77_020267 [Marasmius sp. AFHP31]
MATKTPSAPHSTCSQSSSEGVIVTNPAATPAEQPESTVAPDVLNTSQATPEPNSAPSIQSGNCDDQNHRKVMAEHRVVTAWGGRPWGNGRSGWGDGEDVERGWAELQSPRIVSLSAGRSWSDGADDGIFCWRTSNTAGNPSHRSIVLYARRDLHAILKPLENRTSSVLKEVPSDKWARTMIWPEPTHTVIRSLPEAQHASVPGPEFTLAEVSQRLSQVNADIAAAQATITQNLARIADIKTEQEPLRAYLRGLDNERSSRLDKNEEVAKELKHLAEVQADLRDLEVLAMAFVEG